MIHLNLSSPGQNGHHFADYIFKRIFLNENLDFWLTFPLSLLLTVLYNGRIGDKPLSEPMLTRLPDAYMEHKGEIS